jgi:hypothetical protein
MPDVILNHDVDFAQAPVHVHRAFLGPPARTLFQVHDVIYRIVSIRDVHHPDGTVGGNGLFESPWWMPQHSYRQITMRAFRTGRSMTAVARTGLAVTHEFNPHMDWIAVARMTSAAYGWVGRAAAMQEFENEPQVLLMGGLDQIWLPGLASAGQPMSPHAFIAYFGSFEP